MPFNSLLQSITKSKGQQAQYNNLTNRKKEGNKHIFSHNKEQTNCINKLML